MTAETWIPKPAAPRPFFTAPGTRDPRLDVFRGLAMFIILIAHTPGNPFTRWIPARWGFSDATEIFVFCSGMASALAFGKVFANQGWRLGTARVLFRSWQVYWAHIGLFVVTAMLMVALNATGLFARDYVGQLNLYPFFNNPEPQLIGLMTLTYVPNYFDILPMYLVILIMMPVVVLLARVHVALAAVFCVGLWLLAQEQIWTAFGVLSWTESLEFPAEPWSEREWFFNPLGWQLIFFTGFAFMAGWISAPPRAAWLFAIALCAVLFSIYLGGSNRVVRLPLRIMAWINGESGALDGAMAAYQGALDWRSAMRDSLRPLFPKTDFGLLRYLHFLSLAYVAWYLVGVRGENLLPRGSGFWSHTWARVLTWVTKVGQQSLAIFVVSMVLSRLIGVAFDVWDRNGWIVWLGNFTGFGILIGVAYGVGWFKSAPWRPKRS